MRVLPDAVIGEPAAGPVVAGAAGVLVLGATEQAPNRKAIVASVKKDLRIGAKLRRTDADGRGRTVTS
jgi:hypothetical protein